MSIYDQIDSLPDLQFMALMFVFYAVAYAGWWLFDRWVSKKPMR